MNRKTLKRVVAGGLLAGSFVVSTVPVYADEDSWWRRWWNRSETR